MYQGENTNVASCEMCSLCLKFYKQKKKKEKQIWKKLKYVVSSSLQSYKYYLQTMIYWYPISKIIFFICICLKEMKDAEWHMRNKWKRKKKLMKNTKPKLACFCWWSLRRGVQELLPTGRRVEHHLRCWSRSLLRPSRPRMSLRWFNTNTWWLLSSTVWNGTELTHWCQGKKQKN